jgi:hypothetical protein
MTAAPGDGVHEYQTDHDLLVRLDERYAAIHSDVKDIKDGSNKRLDSLENDHVSRKEFEAAKAEISSLQLWRSALAGAYALGLILMGVAVAYFT